jgi:hypothetical protein
VGTVVLIVVAVVVVTGFIWLVVNTWHYPKLHELHDQEHDPNDL